jgi:hypothetical protein
MSTPERFDSSSSAKQGRFGVLRGLAEWATKQGLYEFQFYGETEANINLLREHLKEGSMVFYINHFGFDDEAIVAAFLMNNFGDLISRIGGPVSKKHYDGRECYKSPTNLLHALALRAGPLLGVEETPVVQHYDTGYEEAVAQNSRRQFFKSALEILSTPGGVVFIAPEGRISPTGTLLPAQAGIGMLAKLCRKKELPVCFVPLAIVAEGRVGRWFNLFGRENDRRFGLNMGAPIPLESLGGRGMDGENIADELMEKLALLLPEELRGVYPSE